jgi:hypothetical protein
MSSIYTCQISRILKPLLRSTYKNESKCLIHKPQKKEKIKNEKESNSDISASTNFNASNVNTFRHEGIICVYICINIYKCIFMNMYM